MDCMKFDGNRLVEELLDHCYDIEVSLHNYISHISIVVLERSIGGNNLFSVPF